MLHRSKRIAKDSSSHLIILGKHSAPVERNLVESFPTVNHTTGVLFLPLTNCESGPDLEPKPTLVVHAKRHF